MKSIETRVGSMTKLYTNRLKMFGPTYAIGLLWYIWFYEGTQLAFEYFERY